MDHGSTCKVESSQLANPAARSPNPVAQRCIDQKGPQGQHDAVSTEAHTLHQGSGDDGTSDDGERHLERSEDKTWKRVPVLHIKTRPEAVVKVANEQTNAMLAVVSKSHEKPNTTQVSVTMPIETTLIIMVLIMLVSRTRPP